MRPSRMVLSLAALLGASLACNALTFGRNPDAPPGCYEVVFLGSAENPEGDSTWTYSVEELSCAQDLSNWMLELPGCAAVLDAAPSPWELVHPDPNFHFDGIKWQTGAGFESGEFHVTLTGDLTTGMVKYGVKGPDVLIRLVEGPVCEVTTATPADALTPSPTTKTDHTPSPPASSPTPSAVTLQPPPAGSGVILVTDNHQTLTFTCDGSAVIVNGNGNTISLLGSCSSITVRGNENRVFWQSGSPIITDTGNGNIISQR